MRLESLKMLVQIQQWSHSGTGMENSMWIELLVLGFCGHPTIFAVYVYSNVINLTNS